MRDEIVTKEIAATLHADATKRREMPAWIVFRDEPDYPGKVIARFALDTPATFALVSDTLTDRAGKSEALMRDQHPAPVPPRPIPSGPIPEPAPRPPPSPPPHRSKHHQSQRGRRRWLKP